MRIPKLFHFIWAGGEKKLPDDNIEVILGWMQDNPNCKFRLWIDEATAAENEDLTAFYQKQFQIIAGKKGIKVDLDKLAIKDITKEEVVDKYIRYEIDRLRPNYGASSDMLRYAILHKYGGVYFDSDVAKGTASLESSGIFARNFEDHVVVVDPFSQDKEIIGNDAFLCTKGNPLMKRAGKIARHNYRKRNKPYNREDKTHKVTITHDFPRRCPVQMLAYVFDKATYIKHMTIELTGPSVIASIEKPYSEKKIQVEYLDRKYRTTRRELGLLWTNCKLRAYPDPKTAKAQALAAVIKSIGFELNVLKILRLEDHVENLAVILKCSIAEATTVLLTELKQKSFNFKRAKAVQNTLRYKNIEKFYTKNGIAKEKYFHFDFDNPVLMKSPNDFHIKGGILRLSRIQEILAIIEEEKKVKKEWIKEISDILDHGIMFLGQEISKLKNKLGSLLAPESEKKQELNEAIRDALRYYSRDVLQDSAREYASLFNLPNNELRALLKKPLEKLASKTEKIEKFLDEDFPDIDKQFAQISSLLKEQKKELIPSEDSMSSDEEVSEEESSEVYKFSM